MAPRAFLLRLSRRARILRLEPASLTRSAARRLTTVARDARLTPSPQMLSLHAAVTDTSDVSVRLSSLKGSSDRISKYLQNNDLRCYIPFCDARKRNAPGGSVV